MDNKTTVSEIIENFGDTWLTCLVDFEHYTVDVFVNEQGLNPEKHLDEEMLALFYTEDGLDKVDHSYSSLGEYELKELEKGGMIFNIIE